MNPDCTYEQLLRDRIRLLVELFKPYSDANGIDTTESLIRDLLADLMHISDYWDFDFNDELRVATLNYQEEVKNQSTLN